MPLYARGTILFVTVRGVRNSKIGSDSVLKKPNFKVTELCKTLTSVQVVSYRNCVQSTVQIISEKK